MQFRNWVNAYINANLLLLSQLKRFLFVFCCCPVCFVCSTKIKQVYCFSSFDVDSATMWLFIEHFTFWWSNQTVRHIQFLTLLLQISPNLYQTWCINKKKNLCAILHGHKSVIKSLPWILAAELIFIRSPFQAFFKKKKSSKSSAIYRTLSSWSISRTRLLTFDIFKITYLEELVMFSQFTHM